MKKVTREDQKIEREKQNTLLRAYGYHWKRTDQLTSEQWRKVPIDEDQMELPKWVLLSPLEMPVNEIAILRWLGKRGADKEDVLQFLSKHDFSILGKDEHNIWRIQSPDGNIVNLKQALQAIEKKRIDQAEEKKLAEKKQFEEEIEQSALSLKSVLDLHGQAMNPAHAWGYSSHPLAKRLPDGRIEVTTYHFENEWRTDILETELDVVRYLYTDGDGGWDVGEWEKA
ncbi:hypothetical protein KSD_47840 [Ktedonobacter sp. SOSP1-85]|uniref:hypothetical protein n=1 Tax=Ktedonobacter sp. SOSP1-85 TaxID=2778367 RepID=UPI001915D979|nr:hypothetical protein [Ktedonobacter sp. SOSP1-85]GHO77013.1 hypothetical protein KSD_47840 [Ktedonobacter sp. SOSP1-85]